MFSDDRQTATLHTRAKVVLSHIAYLLQKEGINESGVVIANDLGYQQRFRAKANIPVDVRITPSEPAKVTVEFFTQPNHMVFNVNTAGAEGKTMDISDLCDRVAKGLIQISNSFHEPQVDQNDDADVTHRIDLQMDGANTSKSTSVSTETHRGNVTHQVRERVDFSPKIATKKVEAPNSETVKVQPQIISEVASLWLRFNAMPKEIDGAKDNVRSILIACSEGRIGEAKLQVRRLYELVKDWGVKNDNGKEIVSKLLPTIREVWSRLKGQGIPQVNHTPDDIKNDALSRLRVIAKVEARQRSEGVLPAPYSGDFNSGGSQKVILTRNRQPFDEKPIDEDVTVPRMDDLVKQMTASQRKDFEELLRQTVSHGRSSSEIEIKFAPHLEGWSVSSRNWSATTRTKVLQSNWIESWTSIAERGADNRPHILKNFQVTGTRYDDIALKVGQKIATVLREHKL